MIINEPIPVEKLDPDQIEIVIVEDSSKVAELILRVVRRLNLAGRYILIKDGGEALDYLFAQTNYVNAAVRRTPRVVFLDLKLPGIDGLEVLRRVKLDERTKNLPVVVLSSSIQENDIKTAYDLGVNSYVTKPNQSEELSSVVEELVRYWLLLNKMPAR